ncbi:MAG: hypothetical protein Q7T33_10945, partial [Dehalococcoidia bacterium]|nr:hypothetical protein [Dehalococcoidia bacterium]
PYRKGVRTMRDKRVYATVAAIAILVVLLGSFLPWVRLTGPFGEFTKRGLEDDSDGIITLALGLAAVWALAYYIFDQGRAILGSASLALAGVALIAVAALNMTDMDRAAGVLDDLEKLASGGEEVPIELVAAEGLYMILIGGVAMVLAGSAGSAAALVPVRVPAAALPPEEAASGLTPLESPAVQTVDEGLEGAPAEAPAEAPEPEAEAAPGDG